MGIFSRVCVAALMSVGAVVTSQPAQAAGDYFYAYVQNLNASSNIVISNVSWSGSYNPQLPTTILPSRTEVGRLKTVLDYGYSELQFDATITPTDGSAPQICHFWFSVQNSSGTIASVTATRPASNTGQLPTCNGRISSGSNVFFSMTAAPSPSM